MKDRRLQDICDAARAFASTVESIDAGTRIELPLLLEAYIDTRQRLTKYLAQMAATLLPNAQKDLEQITQSVQHAADKMLRDSGWNGPSLPVLTYGKTHALILAYLRFKQQHFATTAELRLLVGDQVHTERRLRELRDLGFAISAERAAGQDGYRLLNVAPDLNIALKRQFALMCKREATSSAQRRHLEALLNASREVLG